MTAYEVEPPDETTLLARELASACAMASVDGALALATTPDRVPSQFCLLGRARPLGRQDVP